MELHLFNAGPNWLSAQELEDQLILNRTSIPGEDVNWVRPENKRHEAHWAAWRRARREVERMRIRGPALEFLNDSEAADQIVMVARRHGQEVKLKYNQPHRDPQGGDRVAKRRRRSNTDAVGRYRVHG